MEPISAAAAVVVFCRRIGSGCRVGAVVMLFVASLLLATDAAVVRWVWAVSNQVALNSAS